MDNLLNRTNEIKSLCYICNEPAAISCILCGKSVCTKHQKEGICVACIKGKFIK
ncbi:hypothetical protein KO317_02575 [Candidatus Micrarchaeota archaeon]|nr:hypothetical protein [Candidatus Micrarchaeota archaeon]